MRKVTSQSSRENGFSCGFSVAGIFPGGLHPGMLAHLALTQRQVEEIRRLQTSARSAQQAYFESLEDIQRQLKSGVETAEPFSETQARDMLARKASVMIELEIIRLRADAAVYNLLTT